MTLTRRALVNGATAAALSRSPTLAQSSGTNAPTIRIGVLTDLSGPYRDINGPTALACVRQAVQEFTASKDMRVEVLVADQQNKPDLGSLIARQWFDQNDVDAVVNIANSALALAVNSICREKNKVMLATAVTTTELTGKQCSQNAIHWTFDSWMLAKSSAVSMLKSGGDTWFLIAPDYTFGHILAGDVTRFVSEGGGHVVGSVFYPFPDTTDFSAYVTRARASGAKVLGLCNTGTDAINSIKQAHEFGVPRDMRLVALLTFVTVVHALGLEIAQGLLATETFYWDLNERTRAFMNRIRPKTPNNWPNMTHAGDYAATLHYLKAVADMGAPAAKADGRAVVERMKAMPTDDDCFGIGNIRADGRKLHPSYLFRVKSPDESRHEWDLYNLAASTSADQAARPLSEGGCPFVHG
jgi:branched-chain amino acid transport system substrate-binding protein